ncbi:respiratory burst oxidase protein C [Trifolium repens]|nr:respiratory burst oxidase protein C [Trifolium repens]
MVNDLGILLLHEPTHSTRGDNKYLSQMLSIKLKATYETNHVRKKYRDIIYFIIDIRYSFKGKLREIVTHGFEEEGISLNSQGSQIMV